MCHGCCPSHKVGTRSWFVYISLDSLVVFIFSAFALLPLPLRFAHILILPTSTHSSSSTYSSSTSFPSTASSSKHHHARLSYLAALPPVFHASISSKHALQSLYLRCPDCNNPFGHCRQWTGCFDCTGGRQQYATSWGLVISLHQHHHQCCCYSGRHCTRSASTCSDIYPRHPGVLHARAERSSWHCDGPWQDHHAG